MAQLALTEMIDWQDHCFPVHQWALHTKNFINNKKAILTFFSLHSPTLLALEAVLRRIVQIYPAGIPSAYHASGS